MESRDFLAFYSERDVGPKTYKLTRSDSSNLIMQRLKLFGKHFSVTDVTDMSQ